MKKIFLFCVSFLLLIDTTFAADVLNIKSEKIPLRSEMIKNEYVGLNLNISNNGKNPVKIISVSVPGIVNNANSVLVQEGLSGVHKNNKYMYMSMFTFGITGFVGWAKNSKILDNQKSALAEAASFGTQVSLESMKNEIIMPNNSKAFKVLIPVSQTVKPSVLVQDVMTNKYIQSEGF